MRSSWTDERLDDLNDRVGEISERLDTLSGRVTDLDVRLTDRIDNLQQTMVQGFVAIMIAISTCSIGLAGLIVVEL